MMLWRFTVREIRRRPGRAVLTLLSIVIGVAAILSVALATATTRRAYREMYAAVAEQATLEVVSAEGGGFDETTVRLLDGVAGIVAALPVVARPTVLRFEGKRIALLALGIDPKRHVAACHFELQSGRFIASEKEVMLDAGVARRAGIQAGSRVSLLTRTGLRPVIVVGLLAPRGASATTREGVLFVPLSDAQRIFRAGGQVDGISLVLEDGANPDSVRDAVSRRLPAGLLVRSPAARTQLAGESLASTELSLEVACGFALVAASFIVLNTFLMNVTERRRQLAILRAVGATRGQVERLLLCEGLMMGVGGSALGLLAGLAGTLALTRLMEQLFHMPLPVTRLTAPPFVLAGGLGIGISLLAAYFPARRAGCVSPLEGMRAAPAEGSGPSVRPVTAGGAGMLLVAAILFASAIEGWLPAAVSIAAGMLALVACVLLVPALLRPLIRGIAALLHPVLGIEGRLAARQLQRHRVRTSLTVGVLFVGTSTTIGMGNSILDNTNNVYEWFERTLAADFFVRAAVPDFATGLAADLPDEIAEKIGKIPKIAHLDSMRFVSARAAGQAVVVIVRQFTAGDRLPLDLERGDVDDVRRRLAGGEVVIGAPLSRRMGLGVGDGLPIETRSGPQTLRIAGTVTEYQVGGLVVYMDRSVASRLLGVEGVDAFLIKADAGAMSAVEGALGAICAEHGLILQSFAEMSRLVEQNMAGVVHCLWALLALQFVVTAVGIANTLSMNVLEQTRELGLLRAVAMTRRQVRKLILAQGAILGVAGLVTGLAGGLGVAGLIHLSTLPLLGQSVEFVVHPGLVAACAAAEFVIVMAAAWLPSERAVRVQIIEALKQE